MCYSEKGYSARKDPKGSRGRNMRNEQLEELTIRLVTEYYRNNKEPFYQYADKDILWLGPRAGQMISSRKELLDFFRAETTELSFEIRGMSAADIRAGENTWEIILHFFVTTIFPSGERHTHNQRMQFTWVPGKKKQGEDHFTIRVLDIANTPPMEKLSLYARTPSESSEDASYVSASAPRGRIFVFPGTDDVTYYLSADEILYLSSEDQARKCKIHPADPSMENIICREGLNRIEEKYPGVFLRSHKCYLINPHYVTKTLRFRVTLQNLRKEDVALPVPEKKYTAFKSALEQWLGTSS